MLLGYNTNGMAHHALEDAIRLLAEVGYQSVAITIDHAALAPGSEETPRQLGRIKRLLADLGLRSVIETGARYLLDPRRKHEPTMVSAQASDRARRVEFYRHAIRCAAELQSDCVSLWSGAVHDAAGPAEAMNRLAHALEEVLDAAAAHGVTVGFEPEPGMFIDSMHGFEQLRARLANSNLRLTLDVGHLHCQGECPLADQIRRWAPDLVNVHLEDMRRGVHEHLMFGEGEIEFPPVLETLAASGYTGGVYVELSRHSYEAPLTARRAYEFLQRWFQRKSSDA